MHALATMLAATILPFDIISMFSVVSLRFGCWIIDDNNSCSIVNDLIGGQAVQIIATVFSTITVSKLLLRACN